MNGFHCELAVLRCLLAPYFVGVWVLGIFSVNFWVDYLGKGICPGFQHYCAPEGTLKEACSVIFLTWG